MGKYWVPINDKGTQVKVTPAQFDAALNWAALTESIPDEPRYIIEVFPERDNRANGQRRCCSALATLGVLREADSGGYVIVDMARRHLEQYRYR